MSACSSLSFSIQEPEGKHPSLMPDELELQNLLRECGFEAHYEPHLIMFHCCNPDTGRFFNTGVQPDFFLPGLKLYIELTGKKNKTLSRKLLQAELMATSGLRMVLIDAELWSYINGNAERLRQIILAALFPQSREAAALPRSA